MLHHSLLHVIAATSCSLVFAGALFVDRPAAASPELQTPDPVAASSGMICGLTSSELGGIISHYELTPDIQALAAALGGPFDCDAYGDLCTALDPADAHTYACTVWSLLADHEPPALVAEVATDYLGNNGSSCTPDMAVCADICSPASVRSCHGALIAGECHSLAVCTLISTGRLPFFEDILGPQTPWF